MDTKFKVNLGELDPFADKSLRDYQVEAKKNIYNFWKTKRSVMLQMPTGTGKTRLFVSIARDFHNWGVKNKTAVKMLILAHRHELIDQIDTHLGLKYGLAHGIIMASSLEQKKYPVQIGSVPTLTRRIEKWSDKQFDVIIIDEAHHVKAESYKKILNTYPNAKILGVTATPYRLNGEGFVDEFDGLIVSEPINSFIKKGYLSEYDYYSIRPDSNLQNQINNIDQFDIDGDYLESAMMSVMDTEKVRARIVETYLKYAKGKKGIVYAITKGHNLHICDSFRKVGIPAAAIDCDTKPEEREKIVNEFKDGKIDILCNVNIFSEGFDCPDVEFVQLARPTMSLSMYLQQVGRGLRPAEGKSKLIVLDNVGQYNKFGFPSDDRNWMAYFKGQDEILPDPIHKGDNHGITFIEEIEEGNEQVDLLYSSRENDTITNTEMITTEIEKQKHRTIEDIEKEIEVFKKYGYNVPEELLEEKKRLKDFSFIEGVFGEVIKFLMQKYEVRRNAIIYANPSGKSVFSYTDGSERDRVIEEVEKEIGIFEKYKRDIPDSLLQEKKKLKNEELFGEEAKSTLQRLLQDLGCNHDVKAIVNSDGSLKLIVEDGTASNQPKETKARMPKYVSSDHQDTSKNSKGKKPPLKFSMIGIKKGETLVFVPTNLSVTVASDDEVSYQGKLYKLTAFVQKFHPNANPNNPGSYRGPSFFTYHGVLLTKIRESLEEKDENGKLAKQRNSTRRIIYNRKNWTKIQRVKVGDEIEGLGVVTERYSKGELYPDSEASVTINGKKWDNARIEDYFGIPRKQKVKQENKAKRKAPLTFSMIGISLGATLVFEPTKLKVTVISDNEIAYFGKRYKLSAFVKEFYPKEKQYNSGAYQGSRFFSYRGKLLEEIRQEMNV